MREIAEKIFNNYLPGENLKDEQWQAVDALLNDNRVLVVQPTGWGKSIVYFIAAKLFRDQNKGLTIIISPLLALIRNQLEAAQKMGLNAYTINSDNTDDWEEVNEAIRNNSCDILVVAPERLQSNSFKDTTLLLIQQAGGIGLIVIDEAHCISDWGHDFRPKYKKIVQFVNTLEYQVPMLATTATANVRVANDIKQQLGNSIIEIRGSLLRNNLKLKVVGVPNSYYKLGWLLEHLKRGTLEGTGIIYCTTQKETERVAEWLSLNGISAAYYHSGIRDVTIKEELEQRLINNDLQVLVATIALGMGFDKKDVRFVIHYNMSTSLVTYYQEIGRAGRDGLDAEIVLLYCENDIESLEGMIKNGFTSFEEYENVLNLIQNGPGSLYELMSRHNISQGQLTKILDLLEADGLIYKDGPKYYRSANPIEYSLLQNKNILDSKLQELMLMRNYAHIDKSCLMDFLIYNLGEPEKIVCGKCDNCVNDSSPLYNVDERYVEKAEIYIKQLGLNITPKTKWPSGGVGDLRGNIRANLQFKQGKALSLYKKEGIGELIIRNRYTDLYFSDELVNYCAQYIRDNYSALNSPEWLTAVPSLRNPSLLPDFVMRLSQELSIPYKQVILKTQHSEEQKFMKNSSKQVENIKDTFEVNDYNLQGRVLLIDDIMNSGWTFAICAKLLMEVGCESVTPLALSRT
ncbi:RecQ family ATP-dependent DNA helicase [Lysinibacillus sp. C5.1]|uniref:RecQ family ATP-dependent DNA helicase n=1 Tax=Lysinibacillus sp. C5.1 TaxID=2796169 RepID=UPI00308125C0